MTRQDIPAGQIMMMNYPSIQMMMCGIVAACQTREGVIKLRYEDGTTEERPADFNIEDKTCFEVVGYVQGGRLSA